MLFGEALANTPAPAAEAHIYLSAGSGKTWAAAELLKIIQAVDLSAERTRELSEQLTGDVDAEEFAKANADVGAVLADLVKRYGPAGVQILALVLAALSFYFQMRSDGFAQEQVELGERQVELAEDAARREAARDETTGKIAAEDAEQIAKAVEKRIADETDPRRKPNRP